MADDPNAIMATMLACSTPVPVQQALALVREHYGLTVRGQPLSGERDQNVRLSASGGARYVLKIAHPAESPLVTEFAVALLLHLQSADPDLPCPVVQRTRSGGTTFRFIDEAGAARTGCVLSFLTGRPMGTAARSTKLRAACGRMAARLTHALHGFDHPGAYRALIWDVRQLARVRPLLAELPQFPDREAADELLAELTPRIETQLPDLRRQVVHNDLNALNILVDVKDAERIVGIIDFGDATHTAIAADVAVTAAEQIPEDCEADGERARQASREVAVAYHAHLPLLPDERNLLGALVAARVVTNVVVQQWYLQRNPHGGHHAALSESFIRRRLAIARIMLRRGFEL